MTDIRIEFPSRTFDPRKVEAEKYVLSRDLANAVQVALALGQPLLLTGEPGTGKTRLAWRIAHDLHTQEAAFRQEPLVFNTKTTATAQDLFYFYDALRHFHDANVAKAAGESAPKAADYVELRALGEAIARTNADELASGRFLEPGQPQGSVVLIDEIDKAPRDFPNDLLSELERYSFRIKEAGNHQIKLGEGHRLLVVLTSNSEKNLPEAFLRRCVFYHIPFPDSEQLQTIVKSQLGDASTYSDEAFIAHFMEVRARVRKKLPATAELIQWLRVLELHRFAEGPVDFNKLSNAQKATLKLSYTVLAKTKEDLQELEGMLGE